MAISTFDLSIVAASVITVVLIGISSVFRRSQSDGRDSEEYFLASRTMPWFIISASLFAANIGSEQFIGMAGTAAESGIAVAIYELSAPFLLIMLGWIFAPLYFHCRLKTTPEYLEKRFSKYIRLIFVIMLILTHVLASISATLYAGAVVIEVVTGLTIWLSAPIVVLLTAVYTVTGGLRAVMLTDAVQSMILLTGGVVGSITSLRLVGGIDGLFSKLDAAGLSNFPHLMRPLNDRDFPWLGTWIAVIFGGMRYWCFDQEMAQRALSARDLNHVRLGTAGAALLKLLPLFLMILPGMVARALFEICVADPDGGQFPEWCETRLNEAHEANKAYPLLVLHEFPHGVTGLMLSSFLAAMMSSLASLFNSVSAMFTYDVYARFMAKRDLTSSELVVVGRWTVIGLVLLTLLWIPVIDTANRGLFLVAVSILGHLGPPITAVFACGVFSSRVNEQGALIGLSTGSLIGIIRLIVYLILQSSCDRHVDGTHQILTSTNWIACLNFHYFSAFLFVLTVLITIIGSIFYPVPSEEQIEGHVFTLSVLHETFLSIRGYTQLATQTGIELAERVDACASEKEREAVANEEVTSQDMQQASKYWSMIFAITLPVIVTGTTGCIIYYFH